MKLGKPTVFGERASTLKLWLNTQNYLKEEAMEFKAILEQAHDYAKTVAKTAYGYVESFIDLFRPMQEDTTPKQAVVKGAVKVGCGLAILATVCLAPPQAVVTTIVMLGLAVLAGVQMYFGAVGLFELIMGTAGILKSVPVTE